MTPEQSLLAAIPDDPTAAFALADWLEEEGRLGQAELLRLSYTLREPVGITSEERDGRTVWTISPERRQMEQRLQAILAAGVRPVVPTCTNSIGMTFAWIPPGTFLMGSPPDEEGRRDDEVQHLVTLSRGFWLGATLVTQAQWQAVRGDNPSHFKGADQPVDRVGWEDVREFAGNLGRQEGRVYRLPTEAEWEYACRAGTLTPFYFGGTISTDQANYCGEESYGAGAKGQHRQQTTPVGNFPPNAWGLHDTHGNLWEWCADWYGDYPTGRVSDSRGPQNGECRVLRGGSWGFSPGTCRSAFRMKLKPVGRLTHFGLRLASPAP